MLPLRHAYHPLQQIPADLCHMLHSIWQIKPIIINNNNANNVASDHGRCGEPKPEKAMTATFRCWQKSTSGR